MKLSKNDYRKIAVKAAEAGDDKKAEGVRVLDLCGRSTLADFVVLMTVESAPQLEAVEEEISVRLKREGTYCLHRDGMRSKNWRVLDYGGVLVHVFDAKAAEFYSIEKVYSDARPVEWQAAPAAPAAKRPAPAKKPARKAAGKPAKRIAKKAPSKAAKKPAKKAVKKTPTKKAGKASKKK